VACSGGPDSVALLDGLHGLAEIGGLTLAAAHLDHAIRSTSHQDAAFVAQLCDRLGVRLQTARIDVPARARDRGIGLEQAAREARLEFLAAAARREAIQAVATGHHAADQVETVLHHLFRGAHLRGLAGMRPARPLEGDLWLFRPMLGLTRGEVLGYLRARGLNWREDPTNSDTDLTRNFLRHELLPLLRDRLNPAVDDAILRVARAAEQAEQLLETQARHLLDQALCTAVDRRIELDAPRLAAAPEVVAAAALRTCLIRHFGRADDWTRRHLLELVDLAGGQGNRRLKLAGLEAHRQGDRLELRPAGSCGTGPDWTEPVPLDPGRTVLPDGTQIHLDILAPEAEEVESHLRQAQPGTELLDAGQVVGRLRARPRAEADRFVPLGAAGGQSVSDFLTNARLGPATRREVRCILDDAGIVLLVPLRIADRVKLTDRTAKVLRIRWIGPNDREPDGRRDV
jgi:tRNA(Ile)-lysidine synthase